MKASYGYLSSEIRTTYRTTNKYYDKNPKYILQCNLSKSQC